MSYKKKIIVGIAAALAIMMAGCAKEPTPEEIAASSLAAVTAEEEQMGMRRLDSPNLTEYEKPLADFIAGVQASDPNAVSNALGSVNVFGEGAESLNSWVVSNNYEEFSNMNLHDILIESSKDGKQAELKVYFEAPNEDKSNFVTYTTDFDGEKWAVTPPSGLTLNYVFYAPTNSVSINDVDLSAYATNDSNYGYAFTIPRIAAVDDSPACKITTDIGTYDGHIVAVGSNSYSSGNAVAIVDFTEEQRADMNGFFISCVNNIFDLARANAPKDQYTSYILDADAIASMFPQNPEDPIATAETANSVANVEVFPGTADSGYPDSYVYHFSRSNAVTMNIRYKVSLTGGGECRRLATVTMVYSGDTWKIESVESENSLFTDLTAFSPEW